MLNTISRFQSVFVFLFVCMTQPVAANTQEIERGADRLATSLLENTEIGKLKQIAVVPFHHTDKDNVCTDFSFFFVDELIFSIKSITYGKAQILEIRRDKTLSDELKKQQSADYDAETAARLGRKLGVRSIVVGSFAVYGEKLRVRIQLVDVETSEIVGVARHSLEFTEEIVRFMPKNQKKDCFTREDIVDEDDPKRDCVFFKEGKLIDYCIKSAVWNAKRGELNLHGYIKNTDDQPMTIFARRLKTRVYSSNGSLFKHHPDVSGFPICEGIPHGCRGGPSISPNQIRNFTVTAINSDSKLGNSTSLDLGLVFRIGGRRDPATGVLSFSPIKPITRR